MATLSFNRANALLLLQICALAVLGGATWFLTALARDRQAPGAQQASINDAGPRTKGAYATFVYGDDFVLGVRVLGQSIRETGTDRDLVVVAAGAVSEAGLATLASDGWRVKRTEIVHNPARGPQQAGFPAAFWGVYTKLSMFNLTEYDSIVYLDADTIVVRNIDDAFQCPGFCAALRHSERFNSGVMKIQPSAKLYSDMMDKIRVLPSYTGGDQGFLNAYFAGFIDGPVFDSSMDYSESNLKFARLPTTYNADIGLTITNAGRWHVKDDAIRVIHFTLGPLKPWQWWTSWLVPQQSRWQELRERLPPDSAGRARGRSQWQVAWETVFVALPALAAILLLLAWEGATAAAAPPAVLLWLKRSFPAAPPSLEKRPIPLDHGSRATPFDPAAVAPAAFPAAAAAARVPAAPHALLLAAIFWGFGSLAVSGWMAFAFVPSEVMPRLGWLLCYEWSLLLASASLLVMQHAACLWGAKGARAVLPGLGSVLLGDFAALPRAPPPGSIPAGVRAALSRSETRARRTSTSMLALGAALAVLCPALGPLLGISGLVPKLACTGVAACLSCVYLTWAFMSSATLWYRHGLLVRQRHGDAATRLPR